MQTATRLADISITNLRICPTTNKLLSKKSNFCQGAVYKKILLEITFEKLITCLWQSCRPTLHLQTKIFSLSEHVLCCLTIWNAGVGRLFDIETMMLLPSCASHRLTVFANCSCGICLYSERVCSGWDEMFCSENASTWSDFSGFHSQWKDYWVTLFSSKKCLTSQSLNATLYVLHANSQLLNVPKWCEVFPESFLVNTFRKPIACTITMQWCFGFLNISSFSSCLVCWREM